MVDFSSLHDEYDFEEEIRSRHSSAPTSARMLASAKREMTGKQRCSTRARYSRTKGSRNGLSGTHRRRGRRTLA